MTNTTEAAATEDYREPTPRSDSPARAPMRLVAGTSSQQSDDLYRLLRRRLLILALIGAAVFITSILIGVMAQRFGVNDPADAAKSVVDFYTRRWRPLLMLGVNACAALLLWRIPPKTIRGLRLIELMIIGTAVAITLSVSVHPRVYGDLEQAAGEPHELKATLMSRYVLAGALLWFIKITLYGTLIPNTWRRCMIIVGGMALSPLVLFVIYALWVRPLPSDIVFEVLAGLGFYNSLAVAIIVFGTSRIESLRQQAAQARKLGQYVLGEKLGAGGMGEVYRAEHVLLRRPCAVKLIRSERAGDPKNLRRFEREVQLTATLTHPNTVQIFDYGHADDGTFYYVMEYLPGVTLEELVKRDGPLPPQRAIHLLRQVCGALREAHGRGLIHRDIKPSNIMVCERGGISDVAKLLDFGLVLPRAADVEGDKLTQDGMITGTPAYCSPEQVSPDGQVDERSDIYSLGSVAYYLLTGQPVFASHAGVKLLAAHLYEQPKPIRAVRAEIANDLELVVMRCLAKEPAERFASVASLDAALAACSGAARDT